MKIHIYSTPPGRLLHFHFMLIFCKCYCIKLRINPIELSRTHQKYGLFIHKHFIQISPTQQNYAHPRRRNASQGQKMCVPSENCMEENCDSVSHIRLYTPHIPPIHLFRQYCYYIAMSSGVVGWCAVMVGSWQWSYKSNDWHNQKWWWQ